ncbi:hypothetical protein EWM64_g8309 [Hericium alpestre]|uniref:Rho-GAP domain-containing protein n=1 Tax=Hericium alpestre TaxID=135208 RepID=A0A4Y9ZNX6_9AGAM|nr:hypothetical protein EWM64_g8309 [Hericium alpestre]
MPSFAGMRPPSDGLLAAFSALIARLPRENRDLLRTLTELINATASRKATRMPLSNLTVIFCPSLNMSPPILRVLCEAKNIWDGPLKDAVEEQVIDIKRVEPEQQRGEDVVAVQAEYPTEEESVVDIRMEDLQDGNMQATSADGNEAVGDVLQQSTTSDDQSVAPDQTVPTTRSDQVPAKTEGIADSPSVPEIDEVVDSPPALEQSQSRSSIDNESFVSAGETRPATPQLSNPQSPQSAQILSSSAESLATPSNFSDDSPGPLQDQSAKKLTTSPPHCPTIADAESETPLPIAPSHSRPLPVIIAPLISDMPSVAFPTTERASSTPHTPSAQAFANPEVSPSTGTPPSEASSPRGSARTKSLRMKRPSLSMLFKKRSVSSIGSSKGGLPTPFTHLPPLPTESPCASPTSSGSPSTPLSASSMVTAPMANSRFSLPPMLDTQIDSSSLDLTLGVESVEEGEDENAHSGDDTTVEGTMDAQHAKARTVASDPAVNRIGPDTSISARAISPISPAATISTTSPISPSSSTPTAERFRISAAATSSTTSSVYMSASSSIQGTTLRPQASQASIASSAYNRLSVWDDDDDMPPEDNWADAVLMEAEKGWAARRKSRMPET